MMNSNFTIAQAEAFARRAIRDAGDDPAAQVKRVWLLAFGQPVTDAEIAEAVKFLAAQRDYFEKLPPDKAAKPAKDAPPALTPAEQSLALLCQALISSNRFLYVD
jgi:hypothetical protein